MPDKPISFYDLPEDAFPFTIRFFREGVEVHSIHVPSPGAVHVPSLGRVTRTRIEFATGEIEERTIE
jgi:hypothetical protein